MTRFLRILGLGLALAGAALQVGAQSVRFFGGSGDADRVKIAIDDPANNLPGPPADVGATDFTLEFWFKATNQNSNGAVSCGDNNLWIYGNIIIDRDRFDEGREFGISLGDGRIVFGVSNAGRQERTLCAGTPDLRDQQWHHVAVQRRIADGHLWIFVDGVLAAQADGPDGDLSYPDNGVPKSLCGPNGNQPCIGSDPFLVIGAEKHGFPDLSFFGWVDELRLSTTLRYPSNFTPSPVPFDVDADTAALYHFDATSGTAVVDADGNQSPGVLRAPAQWAIDTPFSGTPSPGEIRFSATTYTVAEGGGSATITATRVNGSSGAATVGYRTPGGGTATAGADYQTTMGTLQWADGQSGPRTFTVPIVDDAEDESTETVTLVLENVTGATLGTPNTATLSITDDDAAPTPGTLRFQNATAQVGENAGQVVLTVTRTGGSAGAVSVSYATANGSAIAGSDYQATSGTLSWADGVTTARTIAVTLLDDSSVEANETFTVGLSNVTGGATLGTSTATVTITDDDVAPTPGTLRFQNATAQVGENAGQVVLTVTRTGGSAGAVSVSYATANGSAIAGSDYQATSGTLSWADGVTTARTIAVTLVDDSSVEANETFTVGLSNVMGGATLGTSTATVTITDDDVTPPPAGSLSFQSAAAQAGENAGQVVLTVTRTGGSAGAVSVAYATANGSAIAGSDYQATSGTLTWSSGVTASQTITVPLLDDASLESNEAFTIVLSNATGGATLGTSTATVTITDDDVPPNPGTLSFQSGAVQIAENAGQVVLTVVRTGGSAGVASVSYTSMDDTATVGSDYQPASGTLTWGDGDAAAQSITVLLLNDTTAEATEQLSVVLSNAVGATLGSPSSVLVTVTDDDTSSPPPSSGNGGGGGGALLFELLALGGLVAARRRRLERAASL